MHAHDNADGVIPMQTCMAAVGMTRHLSQASIEACAADYLQVSEWREGRVVCLDTAEQKITVEPCAHNKPRQQNGQVCP